MMSEIARALEKVTLFADLPESELQILASKAVTRIFPRNSIVLSEGDRTDSLYVVLTGRVKIYCGDEEGHEIVLETLGPHDYFGEFSLLDEEPRSASVMTVEDSQLSLISKENFLGYLTERPSIAINLLKALVRKLRLQNDNIKSLALMDVYGRIAKLLLQMARERDGRLMTEPVTYREIANRVGASKEMVGRICRDLKRGGYISSEGGRLLIHEKLPPRW